MNAALLVLSLVMNLLACGILRNEFCKREIASSADLHAFNAISSALSALTLAVMALASGGLTAPSGYTAALGLAFGLATALCAILCMMALKSGPLSYTNVIVSCSMVIPALSGMALYGEHISAGQYAGIGLMVLSFLCAVDRENGAGGASVQWLLLCLGAFLFSGSIGVMQKLHQTSPYRNEFSAFLIIAFVTSALSSLAMMGYYRRAKGQSVTVLAPAKRKKFAAISLVSGIGIALCNQINLYLAGAMAAILFYPVINGGSMILTTAAGLLLWRERLSRRQWLGLVMGAAAIFLLCDIL